MKKENLENLEKRKKEEAKLGKFSFSFINKNYELLKLVRTSKKEEKFITLKYFMKQKLAMFSLILFLSTIILALIIPLTTQSPTHLSPSQKHLPAMTDGHILGTDLAGRDIWARLWHGLRFSLGLAAVATVIDIFVGILIGIFMGYFPAFDKPMQFIIQMISNIPSLFILTLFVLFWNPTFWVLAFSMTINGWIPMAQYTRGEVFRLKTQEFTMAEQVLGSSTKNILSSYIPLLLPMTITQLIFTIPMAIQYDASLALIGLAVPNIASIGNMISNASSVATIYPLEIIYPILIMTFIIIYVQFIGNGIERALRREIYE
ncbi:MAG: ABC transporter permease [Mycoplasmatales bacterium]|nr:ABC transporter permease [Mycoplasmatales bacterium]